MFGEFCSGPVVAAFSDTHVVTISDRVVPSVYLPLAVDASEVDLDRPALWGDHLSQLLIAACVVKPARKPGPA